MSPEAVLGNPAAWDSIGHLRLVLALEEALGRMLTAEELVGISALADIKRLLEQAPGPR